ncbi:uncharacterized protein LOC100278031 [Zea mays]|uniref:Uncharacterized protein n=1 Tax=Zea mays TaxID=4577 RepID=B6U369_MAIZE|nr:uncharacterized protein LOC100278031 [Zea mays]ACG43802.1 hypothetical protein [Zea mays]
MVSFRTGSSAPGPAGRLPHHPHDEADRLTCHLHDEPRLIGAFLPTRRCVHS